MSKKPNKLWAFGPVLSVMLVVVALYVKRPEFRSLVDEKCPWVKETVGKYAPPFEVKIVMIPEASAHASMPPPAPSVADVPSAPSAEPAPSAPEPLKPVFDLQKVCSDPAMWPKIVALKKSVDFPAVVNGKAMGTLRVPKGSEARLVTIKSGKLGLEYHGGGAWLDLASTDFEERARLAFH